ncbi:MAG: hypothetical protein CMP98_01545 [Gammaproteobacteria bacterium]|nr:hypothetical protein [Gammaproteobacteria bacterium]OUU11549.1 MAG: hypothetical protein CBB94_01655 [Gammaproteobacteria bacterium TMED34]
MTLLYRGTNYNPANVHQDGAQRKGVVYRGVAYTPGSGHAQKPQNRAGALVYRGVR